VEDGDALIASIVLVLPLLALTGSFDGIRAELLVSSKALQRSCRIHHRIHNFSLLAPPIVIIMAAFCRAISGTYPPLVASPAAEKYVTYDEALGLRHRRRQTKSTYNIVGWRAGEWNARGEVVEK
jgi:hypothetical protein